MLTPAQAKSTLYKLLALFSAVILWPSLAVLITAIMTTIGFNQIMLLVLSLLAVTLVLMAWFIAMLWKTAPEIKVSPWASLWILVPFYGVFVVAMLFLEPLKYLSDNKPAQTQLPWSWALIKDSFKHYFSNFKILLKPSLFFFYISIVMGISRALVYSNQLWTVLNMLVSLASIAAVFWVSIALYYAIIKTIDGDGDISGMNEFTKKNYWSYVVIALLMFLIIGIPFTLVFAVALGIAGGLGIVSAASGLDLQGILTHYWPVLGAGGLLVFLLFLASWAWAIYKSIQYSQAIPLLLVENQHGLEAFHESARLTKNRWWGIAWKNQLWGLIVASISMTFSLLNISLTGGLIILMQNNIWGLMLGTLISAAVQGTVQALLMPLVMTFSYKLYKALKQTQN